MKVIGQSIVKANNDVFDNNTQRNNEDYWEHKDNLIAISDGAGGVGIFADKWAEVLVKHVPAKPFRKPEMIDEWIEEFWEEFYNKHSKLMKDPWQMKKFDEEGSLATLAVLWQLGKSKYVYQSYGDSALFVYNKNNGELKIQDNVESVNYFSTHPALINWKTEKHATEFFFEQNINLEDTEEIILATDGIAMYIYGAYMSFTSNIKEEVKESKTLKIVEYFKENPIENFKTWMEALKNSLKSKEDFTKLTSEWYKERFLPNDDYTLVWVENVEKKLLARITEKKHKLKRKAKKKVRQ